MATPPKRGRGRPPLTEAEKKKREKRAQKAKEEAAAKREKEREKKKQQMLNKRKSIRSQVSKKVKEQQELAITRSKMLNTGDLQSRIGGEEDKKVIGMIAAKYFGDLPSVDMNNPIEVQQRLDFFFDACIEARISPVVEWIALVLGIEWVSLKQIMAGKRRDDSLQQKYILKLILQMQSMWAYNGMYGQENPAEWIFRAKNYFGMRDNVEVTVAPRLNSRWAMPRAQNSWLRSIRRLYRRRLTWSTERWQKRWSRMTNGDFIRSMTDEDITENFTRGICELIKHRDPERCQNREHCFHCVKDWLKEKNKIMVRADQWEL